jgi:hypothetical protein
MMKLDNQRDLRFFTIPPLLSSLRRPGPTPTNDSPKGPSLLLHWIRAVAGAEFLLDWGPAFAGMTEGLGVLVISEYVGV